MNSLARAKSANDVENLTGTVARVDARRFVVRTDRGDFEARRATSCLLEPAPGDLVLLATSEHAAWVLAVLEREDGRAGALVHDGDLAIRLPTGRLDVAAQEGVKVVTGKEATMVAGTVDVTATEGRVAVDRLSFFSSFVEAELGRARVLAATLDSVIERAYARLSRSYRVVTELDQVKAERIDYSARKTASIHAENTLVSAEELVKVDGEQIHLG